MREEYIKYIAGIIQDYRSGEIEKITPSHVDKWIKQFKTDDQVTILQEMYHILKQYYLSREDVKKYVKRFLSNKGLFGIDPKIFLKGTNFLHIQQVGKSQTDIIKVIDEVLFDDYNLRISHCGGSDIYVYVDDGLFSGNGLCDDIIPWLENTAPNNCKIIIYTIVRYKQGWDYAKKKFLPAARKKNIKGKGFANIHLNNERKKDAAMEFVWTQRVIGDPYIDQYRAELEKKSKENDLNVQLFRNKGTPLKETLFSSYKNRDIVEKAFLEVGAKLVITAECPCEYIRPLGFDKLISFGFGALFVTYRNVANNCPLALWYGDPESSTCQLRSWYPLFPRKI